MPKARPQRVSITIQPLPGNEPDELEVAFKDVDGSEARGHDLTLTAGKVGTWEITTTAADTVAAGGGFLFQRHTFLFSFRIQDYNPEGRDFVTFQSQTDARLRLIINSARQSHQPSFAQVVVEEGEMKAGDRFTIRIGDRSRGGAGSEVFDVTALGRILGAVDRDGSGTFREFASNPSRILITSDPRPALLRVLGPSIVPPGEPFPLNLVVFDAHHNVCEQYQGEVALSSDASAVTGLPDIVSFGPEHKGIVILEDLRISEPGLLRLKAKDERRGIQALSNPILCRQHPERLLLWGGFHGHTYGDAANALIDDANFKLNPTSRHDQARRVGRYDFGSPGPMAPQHPSERSGIWEDHQQAYRKNDEPGRYVPFLALEVHTRPGGDRNMIFREWADAYYTPAYGDCRMEKVMAEYAGREDVILEAHIGGGPPDWVAYRPKHEPLLEIASGHGTFEWVLQLALDYGYRPAVIGSEDTHLATMGAPMSAKCYMGRWQNIALDFRDTGFGCGPVAAVWAERCERNAIWKAVRERRTFATTGARIILDVSVNGSPGGSEIQFSGPARIAVKAHAYAPVQRVDLIRNDRCLRSWHPGELDIDLEHVDEQPLREAAYYVRLRQEDGEYAWSTPVWADCADGAEQPDADLPMWNAHEEVDLSGLRPNDAETYEGDLRRYLEVEEDIDQFHDIAPVKIVEEVPGRSALFYAYFGPARDPISIRWYFEFHMPRIHLDWGWRDFGFRITSLSLEKKYQQAGRPLGVPRSRGPSDD